MRKQEMGQEEDAERRKEVFCFFWIENVGWQDETLETDYGF